MYEFFEQLLQKNHTTAYKVSKETGISQTSLSNWKSGRSTPSAKNLQKIADFFGVSTTYLLTGEEPIYETPTYNDEYFEIISLYSQLTDIQKETVINMLRSFVSEK